jgi:hypothetical protein
VEEACSSFDTEVERDAAVRHIVFGESRMLEVQRVVSREQRNDGMYVRAWCWN